MKPPTMRTADPADVPELGIVVQLLTQRQLSRKVKRQLKPLSITCPNGTHIIGRVYNVPQVGPVLVASTEDRIDSGEVGTVPVYRIPGVVSVSREVPIKHHRHRARSVAVKLDEQRGDAVLYIECRCRRTRVDVQQLRAWLGEGRPRAMAGVLEFVNRMPLRITEDRGSPRRSSDGV